MTPPRLNRKVLKTAPQVRPAAVICSNINMHHVGVMIRYVFYDFNGFRCIYDEPSYDEMIAISREIGVPFTEWMFLESKCHSCRTGVPL